MDLHMPEVSGQEAVYEFRSKIDQFPLNLKSQVFIDSAYPFLIKKKLLFFFTFSFYFFEVRLSDGIR